MLHNAFLKTKIELIYQHIFPLILQVLINRTVSNLKLIEMIVNIEAAFFSSFRKMEKMSLLACAYRVKRDRTC